MEGQLWKLPGGGRLEHGEVGRRGQCGSVTSSLCLPHPTQAEQELRVAQTEFDRQAEVTRLLLEGISSTHVSPALCPLRLTTKSFHPCQNQGRGWQ
jgi:hypothetical protein